jgi:hypothetical protein
MSPFSQEEFPISLPKFCFGVFFNQREELFRSDLGFVFSCRETLMIRLLLKLTFRARISEVHHRMKSAALTP